MITLHIDKTRHGAFGNPTVFSQVRGTLVSLPGDPVFDITSRTGMSAKWKVISVIYAKVPRMASRFLCEFQKEGIRFCLVSSVSKS